MKKSFLALSVVASLAIADGSYTLDKVNVSDTKDRDNLHLEKNYLDNSKSVKNDLIETLSKGGADYNEALKLMPSVSVETLDPYALTLDQNSIRVRGQFGDTFSKLSNTIEGVPFGISVGQGANGYLVDMNNIESVDFFAGASAPNKGLGLGNTAGAIDMKLKSPKDSLGFEFEQSMGTDSFYKTFGRFDSGKINDVFSVFGSSSIASNDKWTGAGEVNRKNLSAMVKIDIAEDTQLSIFGAFNRFDRHEYKGLTYAETKNLKNNYNKDYNKNLTGIAAQDVNYYDFNKQEMDEYFTFVNLTTKLGDSLLSIKPYFFGNDGERMFGNQKNSKVMKMELDQTAYGGVIEINKPLFGGILNAGWWYQKLKTTPPPIAQKMYNINSNGTLSFQSYAMLTDIDYRISNSPFLSYEKKFDKLNVLAGVRYIDFKFPSATGYNTAGLGDVSADTALSLNPTVKNGMYVDEKSTKEFLPSLLLTYDLTDMVELRSSYNKTFSNPWQGGLWSVYNSNTSKFQNNGISLQNLWDSLKLETADNYEIGAKFQSDNLSIASNLYYANIKNKQVTLYDEVVDLSYYQSNAEAESKGIEVESTLTYDSVDLYSSIYYNSYEFKNNIVNASNSSLQVKGNQVPNTPTVGAKLGLIYKISDFRIMPLVKYMTKRYGDIENKEEVSSYATVDLGIDYRKKNFYNSMDIQIALDIQNIFDKKYIGNIKNDLDDSKVDTTTYYQGAPLSAMLSLKLSY